MNNLIKRLEKCKIKMKTCDIDPLLLEKYVVALENSLDKEHKITNYQYKTEEFKIKVLPYLLYYLMLELE